jgi:hypothetical protein
MTRTWGRVVPLLDPHANAAGLLCKMALILICPIWNATLTMTGLGTGDDEL